MFMFRAGLLFLLLLVNPLSTFAETSSSGIPWVSFSEDVFKRAAVEHKLILLDVEAVWCHWCHVMEKETYSKPDIQKLINKNFIAVRVDQDARPDISTRYQDYGWPATIVLSSNGTDLVKESGFLPEDEMKAMLIDVVAHPVPHEDKGESAAVVASGSTDGTISDELRKKLIMNHEYFFDEEKGGLNFGQRFLNPDSIEYLIIEGSHGNERYSKFARATLTSALKLIDSAWGGAYQYSTDRDWDHPHFEKIVPTQALNIRSFAYGYAQYGEASYLSAAKSIHSYLKHFLTSPEGAFYTSQDADLVRGVHSGEYFALSDTERRKQGVPQIDTHSYSYENGLLISALSALYAVSGDDEILTDAKRAAKWIIANRSLSGGSAQGGGFRHDEKDQGGPYLRDSLAMANGLLSLYSVTGERTFLEESSKTAQFIADNFAQPSGSGFVSYSLKTAGVLKPPLLQEENIAAARYFNLLGHYTGKQQFHDQSLVALKWLSQPGIALQSSTEVGILLADSEIHSNPIHVTVVGHKDDPQAAELFKAALSFPSTYKRTDWWDKREGPMPNPDVEYPELDKPAAFVCTQRRCSLPIFKPEGIAKILTVKVKGQ